MATYPGGVKTFVNNNDGDQIPASDMNDCQDEIAAIESGLVNGLAHSLKPLTTNTLDLGTFLAKWRDLWVARNVVAGGDLAATNVFVSSATIGGTLSVAGAVTLSGVVTNAGQLRASAYNSAVQSVPDSNSTPLTFDTEDFDVGGIHSTSSATSRMTIPTGGDGLYLVMGQTTFAVGATGHRQLRLTKNSATELAYSSAPVSTASNTTNVQIHAMVTLAAADYLTLDAFQNSGGALNVGSSSRANASVLQIVKLW